MNKITNIEDIREMAVKGISVEAIHAMHGALIICPKCEEDNVDRLLAYCNYKRNPNGVGVSVSE